MTAPDHTSMLFEANLRERGYPYMSHVNLSPKRRAAGATE